MHRRVSFDFPPSFTQLFTHLCIYYMVYGEVWRQDTPTHPEIIIETERYTMFLQSTPQKPDAPTQDVDDLIYRGQGGPTVSQR